MKPNSTQTLFSQFICFKYEIRCKNEMLGFPLRFQSFRPRWTLSVSHLKRLKGWFRRSRSPVSSLILSTYLHFQVWTDARIHGKSREAWVQQMGMKKSQDLAREPLSGLRVAITGGTSGLGLALVREFLNRGAQVAFVARRREGVERVVREHKGKKEDIHPIAIQLMGALGGLDVLINNASDLGPTPLALLADTECEDLERALATNLLGPFRLTKALLGALASSAREGRGAVVLNVSSDAAINPYPRWGAYGASKAALHHLSQMWNAELTDRGIRFLSLDPGDMDTPLHAAAVPDANPSELKRPETAAREFVEAISAVLSRRGSQAEEAAKEALYESS